MKEIKHDMATFVATKGRGTPVDTSHTLLTSDVSSGITLNVKEDVEDHNLDRLGSDCWAAVISLKSKIGN